MDSMSIAAAAILFTIGVVWYWQARREKSPAEERCAASLPASAPASLEGLERMEQAVDELITELKATAQHNIQELAGWAAQINELVRAADQRISALRALQQDAPGIMVSKPAPAAEAENESPPLLAESGPITLAETAHRLSEEIADEGEIAKKLGVSRGELRLLFALRQRKEAGAVS